MLTLDLPSYSDLILGLLNDGMILEEEAERYFRNFETFRAKTPLIELDHDGEWVAALNGQIVSAATYDELMRTIRRRRNWQQAYYEYVGRVEW